MQALKFKLNGKSAFFKKPEVNSYYYFTFGQIHKVVLLGMFGAILGYKGYGQKEWLSKKKKADIVEETPEFYERLKELKIAVAPKNPKGYIPKKIQIFNNSVGYASKEQGGNLIVKEQWLENPVWDIYVLLDNDEAQKLADTVIQHKCVYIPYLGKNDHPADISEVEKVDLMKNTGDECVMSSMFPKDLAELQQPDEEEEDYIPEFKYEESLPVELDPWTNLYRYRTFCYTNLPVIIESDLLYQTSEQNLVFY